MKRLSLEFLGTFRVRLDEQPVTHFRSTNVQGMLVYLALQAGRPFPRDSLATLFWPDEPDRSARKNLRQSLYQLRKVLADSDDDRHPFFHVSRQTVQFNLDSQHTLDVADFLEALAARDLETAVSLYNDDLLPAFGTDSREFEEWLRHERERLHRLAQEAMGQLANRHLRNGRIDDAQAVARRQLALEPWSESAHRQLIEALALAGNRSAALAQFDRCRSVLADEIGVSPEPETIALVEGIRNNDLRPIDPHLIAGRYTLGEEIGRGAVGVVYRGCDDQTGDAVAVKALDAERIARNPVLLERFLREGEALQQLDHPNIVKLLAMDERDGRHYLVMEYIEGGDLRQLLDGRPDLPLENVLSIALDLADALTRAHRLDILHRDLKPANILLNGSGVPHLTDFGVARLGREPRLTEHGAIVGTFAYLSPEALMGQPLDERSDIWSFGVLLYEMLTGQRPFTAPTPTAETAADIAHILSDPLPDIGGVRSDVPEALEDLLYRMLAKNRADRIPSVRLVGAELEAILRAIPARRTDLHSSRRARPAATGRTAFETPTPERAERARHNLPARTTPFVGRETELAELERLLAKRSTRLVTVLGPGGIGKTQFALETARRLLDGTSTARIAFPDGVVLVELATLTSVEQMLTAVAGALGFAIEKASEPRQQILDFLSNKQLLILLDNVEHLLPPPHRGADVVTAMLQAAPHVKVIATSRQKLNLRSERLLVLDGLTYPDSYLTAGALDDGAGQLFVQSARRTRVDFDLTAESVPQVTRICRLTEGMPLGIILAAAWIDTLSLAEIADEIQADVDFLAAEMDDLPPRQRSMRAVFEYSWGLLTESEQQVLARLSVFRGGCTREAAHAVTGATLRQLSALVNKSLIQRDVRSGRFTLHDLLRQLAGEKLAGQGAAESESPERLVRTAHSRHYLSWLAKRGAGLEERRQLETLRTLRPDDQNIQAAVLWAAERADMGSLLPALEALNHYLVLTGRVYDAMKLYQETLRRLPPGDDTLSDIVDDVTFVRAVLLNLLQDIGFQQDEEGQPIDIDRLYTYFQARGAKVAEALVCQHLAHRAMREGNFQQALAHFQAQVDIYEEVGEVFRLPLSLGRLSLAALHAGEVDEGLRLGQRTTALAEQQGNLLHKPANLYFLGLYSLFEENDYAAAQERFAEVTALGHELWSQGLNAVVVLGGLLYQGYVALLQGQLDQARRFGQRMVEKAEVRNDPRDNATAEAFAGLISASEGRYEAVNLPALAEREGVLNIGPIGVSLTSYGLGDVDLAVTTVVQAWAVPITMRWPSILLQNIPVVASLLADRGEFARAAALMAMARAHPACPRGWWQIMALVQALDARLQAALSPEQAAAAEALGREMDVGKTAVALLEELKAMAPPDPSS